MTLQDRIHKLMQHGDFDPELVAAVLDISADDVHHALRDNTFEPPSSGESGSGYTSGLGAPDQTYDSGSASEIAFVNGWAASNTVIFARWGNRLYLSASGQNAVALATTDGTLGGVPNGVYTLLNLPFIQFPDSWQNVLDPGVSPGIYGADTIVPVQVQHTDSGGGQKQVGLGTAALTPSGLTLIDFFSPAFVGAASAQVTATWWEAFDDTLWEDGDLISIWFEYGANILLPPGALFT